MAFFLAGFSLLLHTLFWGVGIALLATPRRWRPGWPAWCGVFGFSLQSAVVWIGAHTAVQGTNAYGRWSLVLPLALLVLGVWKAGIHQKRHLWSELKAWRGIGLMMAVVLSVMLMPLAESSDVLTTSSLGSCDAADYAAGARTLQEFSRADRSGFMGLTEVVQVHSVDNFFDYWIRLNHFTPSALIAINAAVFGWRPYELVSVLTAVFVVLSLPIVYWMARTTFKYPRRASAWIAGIYGVSPVLWYAAYHAAMSQILAAAGIALLTSSALVIWRERNREWNHLFSWSIMLVAAYWILLGAYNFILLVCFVPVLAYVGFSIITTKRLDGVFRWFSALIIPLLVSALLFDERVQGLAERLLLFKEYDFGWRIPAMTPEAWLGAVSSVSLEPLHAGLRWTLSISAVGFSLFAFATVSAARRKWRIAASVSLPILLGYWYLQWRGNRLGTNASYDAYKLFAVFYPGILCGLSSWLFLLRGRLAITRGFAFAIAIIFSVTSLFGVTRYVRKMESPPLMVGQNLAALKGIEDAPEVSSINMLIEPFWDRLWANTFLLKKAQYFASHTYEGRRNCGLHGEWNLFGDIVTVRSALGSSSAANKVGAPFSLVRRGSRDALNVGVGEGWFQIESIPHAQKIWRWTKGDAEVRVINPRRHPVRARVTMRARGVQERELQVRVGDREAGTYKVGTSATELKLGDMMFLPGMNRIELHLPMGGVSPGHGDERVLGLAVYSIDLETSLVKEGT